MLNVLKIFIKLPYEQTECDINCPQYFHLRTLKCDLPILRLWPSDTWRLSFVGGRFSFSQQSPKAKKVYE